MITFSTAATISNLVYDYSLHVPSSTIDLRTSKEPPFLAPIPEDELIIGSTFSLSLDDNNIEIIKSNKNLVVVVAEDGEGVEQQLVGHFAGRLVLVLSGAELSQWRAKELHNSPIPLPDPSITFTSPEHFLDSQHDFAIFDLRRADEALHFGAIKSSTRIEINEFLAMGTGAIDLLKAAQRDNNNNNNKNNNNSNKKIAFYCRTQRRASFMASVAMSFGLRSVVVVKGGVVAMAKLVDDLWGYDAFDPEDPVPPRHPK
jgi:rhodanese-related sulfurtransferase